MVGGSLDVCTQQRWGVGSAGLCSACWARALGADRATLGSGSMEPRARRALQCRAGAPQLPGASPRGEGGRPCLSSQSPGPRGAGIRCLAASVGHMGSCFLRERVLAVVSALSCLLRRFYTFHDFGSWFSLQKAGGGGWVTAAREVRLFLQSEQPFPRAEPGRDAPCHSAG